MAKDSKIELDNIHAKLVDGVWFVQQDGSPFYGKGDTVEAACQDLSARIGEYNAFSETSGLQPFEVRAVSTGAKGLALGFWRNFRVVIIFALCCIPLSYAISTGVKTGLKAESSFSGGRKFWSNVEQAILKQGADDKQLPPEKVEALSKALGNIIEQARPFTSQLPQLFEPKSPEPNAAQAQGDDKVAK